MSETPWPRPRATRAIFEGPHDIPIVDIEAACSLGPSERRGFNLALDGVCKGTGFFFVARHGILDALLARAECQIDAFFRLPLENKILLHIANSPNHRGYVPCGEENALGSVSADVKEAFDMGREASANDPDVIAAKPFHGPNVWPDALPEFKSVLLDLYDCLLAVSARLGALFASCLELPGDYFAARTKKHLCELRIAKYPPRVLPAAPAQVGCGEHTDYGVLSLLWQIDHPGLQLRHRNGAWIDVPSAPGLFVCILGDMTSRLTNDVWQATRHRVINSASSHRHSAIFFYDPDYDCVIQPLRRFVAESGSARYAPITMGEHMARGYDGSFRYRSPKEG